MGNHFGHTLQITTFGESHGKGVGCVILGCPANIPINVPKIQKFLHRRKPGQNLLTSPRQENDQLEVLSGIYLEKTLGTPIAILVRNSNQKSKDYFDIAKNFRPSHGDLTTYLKYGHRDPRGGGRSSARETVGRVAAGGIAQQILQYKYPKMQIIGYVERIKDITCPPINQNELTVEQVEQTVTRCPDSETDLKMQHLIMLAIKQQDTLGGTLIVVIQNPPTGLGEPVFSKLDAELAKAMLSIPAVKSFEIGSGLAGTYMYGSEHNDAMGFDGNHPTTMTNHSGGIQGGISNGMPIVLRVGFKPVSTIFRPQTTLTQAFKPTIFQPLHGRHDPCVLTRAVPIVEAMAWIVLCDMFLQQNAKQIGQNSWQKF